MTQRRSFFKSSVALASVIAVPGLAKAAQSAQGERVLRLYNTHTGESLKSVFWAEGQFIPDSLQDINKLLRDHRNNKIAPIDPKLLVLLDEVGNKLGDAQLHIISGYRSPESNAKLAANGKGVAKHSMHMDGKAIDIRMPGKSLVHVHKAAMAARGGGVGYYADSQFVHMDTGRVRYW
jgi:uncharacterized protein YcbK (DUF882 family)